MESQHYASRHPLRRSKPTSHLFSSINLSFGALVSFVSLYLGFQDPLLLATLVATGLITATLWYIGKEIPSVERILKTRFKSWHIISGALSLGVVLNLATPVHAIFLSGLETFVTGIVAASATASGGTAIDAGVIALVFNLFRLVFLLLVVAAALFAYNQAQQGNDWRPIVTQVSIAIAIVIAVDILTALFVDAGG